MEQTDVVRTLCSLPGVVAVVASESNGAPEVSWGDTFFFHDPDDREEDRRHPFATIVTQDYPGHDTASRLDRPGVYRVDLGVGAAAFAALFGFEPADHPAHRDEFDPAAADVVVPHPVYAAEGWVSVVVPADATEDRMVMLATTAHAQAASRRPAPT